MPIVNSPIKKNAVGARHGGRDENKRSQSHSPKSKHHALFEPLGFEEIRRRYRHDKVGNVKRKRHQIGLKAGELQAILK